MAQIGLNNGARHARVSGYAVSFTGKLSGNQDLKVMQDEAVIAAARDDLANGKSSFTIRSNRCY